MRTPQSQLWTLHFLMFPHRTAAFPRAISKQNIVYKTPSQKIIPAPVCRNSLPQNHEHLKTLFEVRRAHSALRWEDYGDELGAARSPSGIRVSIPHGERWLVPLFRANHQSKATAGEAKQISNLKRCHSSLDSIPQRAQKRKETCLQIHSPDQESRTPITILHATIQEAPPFGKI